VDGEKEQEPAYFNHEIYLKAGDVLFQYTDGVPETVNGEKKFFGMESLKETLESLACTDPKELVDAVNHVLEQYRGTEKQFDDITILSLLYKGVDADRTGANEVG
jgi:sigma-B regulation protein RsbU (phosphoserine phosphatase)